MEKLSYLLILCYLITIDCILIHHSHFKSIKSNRFNTCLSSTVEASTNVNAPGTVTVLRCDGLTKSYVGTPQFQDISLTLGKGQRIGLIGVNGAGKSTLLKCLAKIETIDSGNIEMASNTNIIYVDQEPDWGNICVYEALFSGKSDLAVATRQYLKATGPSTDGDDDLLAKALDSMTSANAWDYQTNGFSIAERLNINEEKMYRDVSTLSGGKLSSFHF